jgi:hypothetical protein
VDFTNGNCASREIPTPFCERLKCLGYSPLSDFLEDNYCIKQDWSRLNKS